MSQIAPAGYITRTRARELNAMDLAGVAEILGRWRDRSVEQITNLTGAEKTEARIHTILGAENAVATAELDALHALMLERLNAGADH